MQTLPATAPSQNLASPPVFTSGSLARVAESGTAPVASAQVAELRSRLDVLDPVSIQTFGDAIQDRLIGFNGKVLSRAKQSDLGDEVSGMINGVLVDARRFDPEKEMKPGLVARLLGRVNQQVEAVKAHFSTVESRVDAVAALLTRHADQVVQDGADLRVLYDANFAQFGDLEIHLAAAREALADLRDVRIPELEARAASGDLPASQAVERANAAADRLDKKISDLEALRMDCILTAQQVRIMEENAIAVVDTVRSTVRVTIQQWKKSFSIALILRNQRETIGLSNAVQDVNEAIQRKNAQMIKATAIETAQAAARPAISVDTLKHVHGQLIETLDGVADVTKKARVERIAAREEMGRLEGAMRQRLLGGRTA